MTVLVDAVYTPNLPNNIQIFVPSKATPLGIDVQCQLPTPHFPIPPHTPSSLHPTLSHPKQSIPPPPAPPPAPTPPPPPFTPQQAQITTSFRTGSNVSLNPLRPHFLLITKSSMRLARSRNPFSNHCAGMRAKRRVDDMKPIRMPSQKPARRARRRRIQRRVSIAFVWLVIERVGLVCGVRDSIGFG